MTIIDGLLAELEQEAGDATRARADTAGTVMETASQSMSLNRSRCTWRPCRSLVAELAAVDTVPRPSSFVQPGRFVRRARAGARRDVAKAKALGVRRCEWVRCGVWNGGREIWPCRGRLRSAIMLNHWYHHRGQLLVYLRLLNLPVPSVWADGRRNPFAA
jgi:hypothetical protein